MTEYHDAAYYEEEARRHRAERVRSERDSDTDGFVSQWASGLGAQLADAKAALARSGRQYPFLVLTEEASGRVVAAKLISSEYGPSWLLSDAEAERFGRRFVPSDGTPQKGDEHWKPSRSRVQKSLGLVQSWRLFPAWAKLEGAPGARGLSGAHTVGVVAFRTDKIWAGQHDRAYWSCAWEDYEEAHQELVGRILEDES